MKTIKNLREVPHGLLLDLAKDGGRTAVSFDTGDIMLDEGFDDECYYGAVIPASSFDGLEVIDLHDGTCEIAVRFAGDTRHILGIYHDRLAAEKWVIRAESAIKGFKQPFAPALETGYKR